MSRGPYIAFVKCSGTESAEVSLLKNDSDDISRYYESLVNRPVTRTLENQDKSPHQKSFITSTKTTTIKQPVKSLNELMRCCERNNLNGIRDCLLSGLSINDQDMFGWTGLMVAVSQRHIEATELILQHGAALEITNKKGQKASDIAKLVEFITFPDIVEKFSSTHSNEQELCSVFHCETISGHCSSCNFDSNNLKQHISSMSHLLQKPRIDQLVPNFRLGPNNKGYQLMRLQGWTGETGLGSIQNGRLYPIQPKKKNDRSGVGVKKDGLVKLKSASSFISAHEMNLQRLRDCHIERRIRHELNS